MSGDGPSDEARDRRAPDPAGAAIVCVILLILGFWASRSAPPLLRGGLIGFAAILAFIAACLLVKGLSAALAAGERVPKWTMIVPVVAAAVLILSAWNPPPRKEEPAPSALEWASSNAMTTMLLSLKDPGSARFASVHAFRAADGYSYAFCGLVNSRNSFGALTGFQPFVALPPAVATAEEAGYDLLAASACPPANDLGPAPGW